MAQETLFDVAGGQDKLLAMTRLFYKHATDDDVLGEMFAKVDPHHADYLAKWLSAGFGGPEDYLSERGDLRFVIYKHMGLEVTEAQRARWESLMLQAADEVGMDRRFLIPFRRYVGTITHHVVAYSTAEPDDLRAYLGLQPGEDMEPLGGSL